MNLSNVLAFAIAELRSILRLTRTWVVVLVASGYTVILYVNAVSSHAYSSSVSSVVGLLGPSYVFSTDATNVLVFFVIGVVFLAFDIRTRDLRDRIAEVLASRPVLNIDVIAGRCLGIVTLLLAVMTALLVAIAVYGSVTEQLDLMFSGSPNLVTLSSFLLLDVFPNLAFWCSLTVLFAVILRYRILVVLVMGACLSVYYLGLPTLPVYLREILDPVSTFVLFPSDLLSRFISWSVTLNHLIVLMLSAGFVVCAAALHPRVDSPSRWPKVVGGVVTIGLAGVILSLAIAAAYRDLEQFNAWVVTHRDASINAKVDIHEISGSVDLRDAGVVGIDLQVRFEHTLSTSNTGSIEFALNPGYEVKSLKVDGANVDSTFENGLLRVPYVGEGSEHTLHLVATGALDTDFGYLDSDIDAENSHTFESRWIGFMGTENSIVDRRYVALMPGIYWYPVAGSAYTISGVDPRPEDFFDVNIRVQTPHGWTVAGPSKSARESAGEFTFVTTNPVPKFALMASDFEVYSTEVEGVTFQVLLDSAHTRSIPQFAFAKSEFEIQAQEILKQSAQQGFRYPFDVLSFVEVPVTLRGYGGGFAMKSVQAMPGMLLMRESGFPTARFTPRFRVFNVREWNDDEKRQYAYELIASYFTNDIHGGNAALAISRNYVGFQTSPSGEGALALGDFVHQLAKLALFQIDEGYFSMHTMKEHFWARELFWQAQAEGRFADQMPERLDDWPNAELYLLNRRGVWEQIEDHPLPSLDFLENPRVAMDAIFRKNRAVAGTFVEMYGYERALNLLGELQGRFRGRSYSHQDLLALARELGTPIDSLVGDWVGTAAMPGFSFGDASQITIPENRASSDSQYQTSVDIVNHEPVPGMVEVRISVESGEVREWSDLESLLVGGSTATRLTVATQQPIKEISFNSRLSLNRSAYSVEAPSPSDVEDGYSSKPYVQKIPFPISENYGTVIVDDLDSGFSFTEPPPSEKPTAIEEILASIGLMESDWHHDIDRGMKALNFGANRLDPQWFRGSHSSGYGKYRRTYAVSNPGGGTHSVTFSASLPRTGNWRLEYHMPELGIGRELTGGFRGGGARLDRSLPSRGSYDIKLLDGEKTIPIEFDSGEAVEGWNKLGEYMIQSSSVSVVVSNATSGDVVFADAIRWTDLKAKSEVN